VIAADGDLVVERDPSRPSGRLLRDGTMDTSYVDLADPAHLEFDYMRWMRLVLRATRARRVIHVGGGGCALARSLAAGDHGSRHEVCENDARVLTLAREHMGLRRAPGLRVHHADGRAFLAGQPDAAWDAVVIDAFTGAAIPTHLVTAAALADVARVAPLALINVVDDRARRIVRAVAAGLASAYPTTCAVGARAGNTVLVGAETIGRTELDRISALAAADRSPARLTEPAAMAQWLEAAQPFAD
jgi:spermidine synthase